ncbi:MAG: AtpZ/AtpI family protein [Acidobacteriaceae bacterium]
MVLRPMGDDLQDGAKNEPGRPRGVLGDLVKAESMIQLALVLPAACLIGAVLGSALDKHFHTTWMALTGILLGAAAGFIQVYRTAARFMRRDK